MLGELMHLDARRDIHANFDAMNVVYDAWLDRENVPARACVETRPAGEEYLIEIMVTAVTEAIET